MFTSEFDAEVDESESVTLQQYYREAMIQGYNFGFEVGTGYGETHGGTLQLLCDALPRVLRILGSKSDRWWSTPPRQACRPTLPNVRNAGFLLSCPVAAQFLFVLTAFYFQTFQEMLTVMRVRS